MSNRILSQKTAVSVKQLYVSNFSANTYITIGYQRNNCRNQNLQQSPSMSGTNSRITRLQRTTLKLHAIIMLLRIKEKENRNWEVHTTTTTTFICTRPCRSSRCRTAPPRRRRTSDLATHRSIEGLGVEKPGRRRRAPGQGRRPPGQHTATLRWVGGATSSSCLVGDGPIADAQAGLERKQGIC
jgi:hypothetical protein